MEFSEITKKYWEKQDWEDLEKAKKIADLYKIAERIIGRMEKPMVQICGPIATGGLGSIEANLEAFNETIKKLQNNGLNVFDQMPFEAPMQRIKNNILKKGEYGNIVLTDFYYPLFESGIISKFYFMPNWESSYGANIEHQKAKELGIEIIYL